MPSAHRMNFDPRKSLVAQRLIALILEDVPDLRIRQGADHYAGHDRVLREALSDWVAQTGKETADAAVCGLHHLDAIEYLTRRERSVLAP